MNTIGYEECLTYLENTVKIKSIPVLFITNGLLLNKQHNIDNLLKYGSEIKISLQVLDSNKT